MTHQHEPFPTPDEPADRWGVAGATTDGALLGGLMGAAAPAFRRAAAAGTGGQYAAMFEVVKAFDHDEVHAAVDTALDLLAGYLFRGGSA